MSETDKILDELEREPQEAPPDAREGSEILPGRYVGPSGKQVPYFTKENAREMQARGVKARKEKVLATRGKMQDLVLPHVEKMISQAVEKQDFAAFWKAFEHAFGKAPESVEVSHDGDVTIVIRSAFAPRGPGDDGVS